MMKKATKPPARTPAKGKAKPKAKVTSSASAARKPATKAVAPSRKKAAKATPAAREQASPTTASQLISERIEELGGWRGKTLARMRELVLEADPDAIEEVKWGGTPVWSDHGIICTGEAYKSAVKLTFAWGAFVADPAKLFNSSLDGNQRRAIDIKEGETVNPGAFKTLVKAAVALNVAKKKKK